MVRQVTASEAKTKLLALLDELASGDEIEITKHGHTVARLVPVGTPRALRGRMTGSAHTACDEEDLFSTDEDWEAH